MYNRRTSIEYLFERKKISLRTLNRCRDSHLLDLGQICNFCEDDIQNLLKINGLGKKGVYEIGLILNEMVDNLEESNTLSDNQHEDLFDDTCALLNEAYDYAFSISQEIEDILKKIYPSSQDLHAYILIIADGDLTIYKEYSKEVNIKIREFCLIYVRKTLNILERIKRTLTIYKKYKEAELKLLASLEKFTLHEEAMFMHHKPVMLELMQLTYEKLAEKYLTRLENNYRKQHLSTFDKIVPFFDKDARAFSTISERKSMHKTFFSMARLTACFKDKFLKYYELADNEACIELFKLKFPFLDSNQRKFMCDFISENSYTPLFFLLYNYIRTSEDINNQVISYLYGFYDSKCLTKYELATKFGISPERVRQLREKGVSFGKASLKNVSYDRSSNRDGFYVKEMIRNDVNLSNYNELFNHLFIIPDSALYKTIKEQEHLNVSFRAFARILITLNSDFYEWGFDKKGTCLLINKRLKVNPSKLKDKLDAISSDKYYSDTIIYYEDFLDADENLDESICVFIKYLASHFYNLNVSEEGILMSQNGVDVFEELYNILKEKNSSMSLEELFNAFKDKFPLHKYSNPQQITSCLLGGKNKERICSIGKTARYILKTSNQNTDTIRDIVRKFLHNSDVPMKMSDILREVITYYPNTNEKNIKSSMQSEKTGCFVEFQGGFWGMEGKLYPSSFEIKTVLTRKRERFLVKLEKFKNFVEKNHRFPLCGLFVGEEEASLYRFQNNIKSGVFLLSNDEMQLYNDMLKNFERYYYPRNAREENFLNSCENMKRYIREFRSIPTPNSDKDLSYWYYRAKRDYNSYTDYRRKYMTDLIDFIKSLGFHV